MLGKLLKHEIKATSKEYLLLYGAFLVITLFNKVFLEVNTGRNTIISIFQGIFMMIYLLMCMSIFLVTIILIIRRFYKNFLGDEGYLTFTLPVKTYELILSKLIIAVLWNILSFIVFGLSLIILLSGHGIFEELLDFFNIYGSYFKDTFSSIVLFGIFSIVSTVFSILTYYLSMAGGQLIGKYRIIGAIGIYFALNFITQVLSTCILFYTEPSSNLYGFYGLEPFRFFLQYLNQICGVYIIFELVFSGIFFFLTNYLFSKKLNLE